MYPFELHLTTGALPPGRLAHVEAACEQLQAKPLVIELARGMHTTQPMFSKVVHAPDLSAALALAAADAAFLHQAKELAPRLGASSFAGERRRCLVD